MNDRTLTPLTLFIGHLLQRLHGIANNSYKSGQFCLACMKPLATCKIWMKLNVIKNSRTTNRNRHGFIIINIHKPSQHSGSNVVSVWFVSVFQLY